MLTIVLLLSVLYIEGFYNVGLDVNSLMVD